jgi:hypothetical protein
VNAPLPKYLQKLKVLAKVIEKLPKKIAHRSELLAVPLRYHTNEILRLHSAGTEVVSKL